MPGIKGMTIDADNVEDFISQLKAVVKGMGIEK